LEQEHRIDYNRRANFTPDGMRMVMGSDSGIVSRVWDIKSAEPIGPEIAEDLAAFWAGAKLDPEFGTLTQLNVEERLKIWEKLQPALSKLPDWRFASERFFSPDPKFTSVSRRMTITIREGATCLLSTQVPENIQQAAGVDPGNPLLPFAYATIDIGEDPKNSRNLVQAAWLCDYGVNRLPADLTAADLRHAAALVGTVAESLPDQKKTGRTLLDRAAKLEPEDEETKKLRASFQAPAPTGPK
jgi:hypothetical protein